MQLYIISLHLFSLLPGVTTWRGMSANTRKNQVTRLVTLRHRSTMSGALISADDVLVGQLNLAWVATVPTPGMRRATPGYQTREWPLQASADPVGVRR